MMLSDDEIRTEFNASVVQSGHPDPVGYMSRIMLTSEADPEYVDVLGKVGIMPVDPEYAADLVGAFEVQSLTNNIVATLHMDIMLYQQLQDLELMVIAFHDGLAAVDASEETQAILDALPETRVAMTELLYPRLATVDDVIDFLGSDEENHLSKKQLKFYEYLSDGRPS